MNSKINPILTIEYMCKEPENQFFERKSAKKSLKELANQIAGLANASGGTLVIGISDDGLLEGFENYEEKYNKCLKLTSGDYLRVIPRYENETLEIKNNKGHKDKILLIHVKPSISEIIRNSQGEIYLRQGDSTNKVNEEQGKILSNDKPERYFEEKLNIRTKIEDIDLDMVEIYRKAIGAKNIDKVELLRVRQFLQTDESTGKEHLTNAGTLLFAKDPSLFFPSARIRIVKFDGTEMQTGASLNVIKDKTFALPLYKQIKEAQSFVETQLRDFTHLQDDGQFITVPEYPRFAWEERNNKCHST